MDQTPTSRHDAHPFSDQEGMGQETALSTSELENPTSEPEPAVFDTENPAATASELDTEDLAE